MILPAALFPAQTVAFNPSASASLFGSTHTDPFEASVYLATAHIFVSYIVRGFLAYHIYRLCKRRLQRKEAVAFFPPILWGLLTFFVTVSSISFLLLLALFAALHYSDWFNLNSPPNGIREASGQRASLHRSSRRMREAPRDRQPDRESGSDD